MRAWCLMLISGVAACHGGRAPPIEAGDGVKVVPGDRPVVAVDPNTVPLVPSCKTGEIIRRTSSGWECAHEAEVAESVLNARLNRLSSQLETLEQLVADNNTQARDLAAQIDTLRASFQSKVNGDAAWPFAIGAVACAPSQDTVLARTMTIDGQVRFRDGQAGQIVLYCPVIATNPTQTWATWTLRYQDGDGRGALAQVTAQLLRLAPDGMLTPIALIDSNAKAETANTEIGQTLPRTLDLGSAFFYVEIKLIRSSADVPLKVSGIIVGGG